MKEGQGRDSLWRHLDWRLVIPLMVHGLTVQTLTGMLRVTTSYRVLELDIPIVWLGSISATFALLPVFLAVQVGRFIDRGNDALAAKIGSGLMLCGAIGLRYFSPTAPMLLASTAILGIGHLFLMASHQMICVRAAGEGSRDAMFGNFLVANGVGQSLGPFLVGWIGGAAKVPDTAPLFAIGLAVTAASFLISLTLPAARNRGRDASAYTPTPLLELMKIHGFVTTLVASIITITAQDLIVIYLPLLGSERSIDVNHIGMILTVRSITAIISRLFYSRLISTVGRIPLTLWSMSLSGLAYASLGAPVSLHMMYVASAILGLGLGICTTLSLTSVLDLVPMTARATALSLRITGNRIGQVTLPFIASIIAAAAGAPGVLAVIGGSLIVSAYSVHHVRGARAKR
jgi:MFS family permease